MIKTVFFEKDSVVLLDQSRLPGEIAYVRCTSAEQVAEAIRRLQVRGAPLIGVAAAFGLALAVGQFRGSREQLDRHFQQVKSVLAATRPTAVNLFWALQRMDDRYQQIKDKEPEHIGQILIKEAQRLYQEDIEVNKAIGEWGQELLQPGSRVMTICNAGALATCGYGTALGIIRSASARDKIQMVWACETRPVLQGARLTIWELHQDGIPATLITDSMAGYVMQRQEVDAVVVGADRIAANGDTANKIGTYTLAVLARYHHIPFYVAAPLSTIDTAISSGQHIVIEERHHDEVREIQGIPVTVPGVNVFNPAFDVTPHDLIEGIITENGLLIPPYEKRIKQIQKG